MSGFTDTLKKIAPTLIAAAGGPMGAVAMQLLGGVFGDESPTVDKINKVIQSGQMTGDQLAELQRLEMQYQENEKERGFRYADLEFQKEKAATEAVTDRWQADMSSDSALSKAIRPMVLIYILSLYALFALMSAWNINVQKEYVVLLGQWGMMVMSAYFIGRTAVQGIEMVGKYRSSNENNGSKT